MLYALGEDPGIVMDEMGHSDPDLALKVYRQSMRRDGEEKNRLKALVDGADMEGLWTRPHSGSDDSTRVELSDEGAPRL